jgi:hypothetical protein
MPEDWDLPRPPEYFLDRLADLHRQIRERLYSLQARATLDDLAAVAAARGGDTIFALDERAEEVVEAFFTAWGEELPLLLEAEGIPGGERTYPQGTPRTEAAFTCILDPIDGTRGLMYQKRSAWVLSGVARAPRDALPRLDDVRLAVQTELPTARSHLSDVLWAVEGTGTAAETHNLLTGAAHPFRPRPSQAGSLLYGFGTVAKFFPGGKALAAEIEEQLMAELLGPPADGNPQVFDDQYISSGGQLYELTVGHDRFIADLRPLLLQATESAAPVQRLCSHPYDLCTELIAREAGVVVTDERGQRLRYPLDIHTSCSWIGYANPRLQAQIEPVLQRILFTLPSHTYQTS